MDGEVDISMMTSSPACGFQPVVQSSNFEHWRDHLQQQLGECRVTCTAHDQETFQASIRVAHVGPLSLVELHGDGGGLELLRRQSADLAVLWIPEHGTTLEQQADQLDPLISSPGQGLWIAPAAELQGQTPKRSSGVSILLPRALLAVWSDQGGDTSLLDPFRTVRQPTVVALLRQARALIDAARLHPEWLDHSAGEFWRALVNHRDAVGSCALPPPSPDLTDRFLQLVQKKLKARPAHRFGLQAMALELHCSARTLQNHLRSDLDATPREIWTALQVQHRYPA